MAGEGLHPDRGERTGSLIRSYIYRGSELNAMLTDLGVKDRTDVVGFPSLEVDRGDRPPTGHVLDPIGRSRSV